MQTTYFNWRAGQPDNFGPPAPYVQENYVTVFLTLLISIYFIQMDYDYPNGGGLGYWDDQAGTNYYYLSMPLPYTCKRPQ